MSYHTIILVGNLGRDPEMRYTPSGQAVTNFSVAVNDNYTNSNGEKVERTIWVRVSTWGRQAETCNQYLKKGRKVLVEGRLNADAATGGPRIWSRQDGTPSASYEVSASTVRFLSTRSDSDGDAGYQGGEGVPYADPEGDNIPF
ncbi:MAG: single-stranded DNA-binding protein [Chloroflexota bacterium]